VPPLATLRAGSAGGRNVGSDERVLQPSSYVDIKRIWKSGDSIELLMPKSLRLEPTPDNSQVNAIVWGPLVLASDWGPRKEGSEASAPVPVPVLVSDSRPLSEWLVSKEGRQGDFVAVKVARVPELPAPPADVSLRPFYRTHRRRYSVYFDTITENEFESRAKAAAAERERIRKMEAATIAYVAPGDAEAERKFHYQSEPANRPVTRTNARTGRGGSGWFSFDLPAEPDSRLTLVLTYLNELGLEPANGNFQILADGTPIARFQPAPASSGFYDAGYPIPTNLITGKTHVTVRFEASDNGRIAPVFGVRLIRD
jgi:hypothetical protein